MSLGHVIRKRNCRAANLAAELIFLKVWQAPTDRIHCFPELARRLVNLEIFKGLEFTSSCGRLSAPFCNFVTHVTFLTLPFEYRRLKYIAIGRRFQVVLAKSRHGKFA